VSLASTGVHTVPVARGKAKHTFTEEIPVKVDRDWQIAQREHGCGTGRALSMSWHADKTIGAAVVCACWRGMRCGGLARWIVLRLLRLRRGLIPKICARGAKQETRAASRAERAPSARGENHAFGLNELMENGIAY